MGRHLALLLSLPLAFFTWTAFAQTKPTTGICPQPQPAAQASNFTKIFDDPDVQNKSIQLLAGAVRFPTMSFDDMKAPGQDDRWAPFDDLHKYMEDSFPTLYSTANLTVAGGYSLIFTLNGSDPSLKPLMITGHQDVVPATTSLDRWTFPPFSGTVDDVWIYGRGSADCKNTVIGAMIAVEHLLQSNWKPTRTLILAFGQDEEIGGHFGAAFVNQHLLPIYGENGIAMIVDEGGSGIDDTQFGQTFALPGVVEKGSINIKTEVDMAGGHASIPTDHTSIGVLSEILVAFENSHIFKPHLEEASPVWAYLQCAAQFGNPSQVPAWIPKDVASVKPNFQDAANNFANLSVSNRYLVQTSKAATLFNAGVKSNELPESAIANINVRIDIFSSVEEVQKTYLSFVTPVAKKYSLNVNGTSFNSKLPSIGNITVSWGNPHPPTPTTSFSQNSTAWRVITELNQAIFAGAITAPSAMTGNTDTRNYLSLTRNVFRWSPARVGQRLGIHTVDERISVKSYLEGLKFYTELIVRMDSLATNDGL